MLVQISNMRISVLLTAALLASLSYQLGAAPPQLGEFRLAEGPDAAGGLAIYPDGSFEYFLSVGALDEQSSGRWEIRGNAICLFTEPKPVPPAFVRSDIEDTGSEKPTLIVTWPDGRGIAGIDFLIGFENGDTIEGYTQEYGWFMPEPGTQNPQWIEVSEPIYRIAATRFDLDPKDKGRLRLVLVPNDLGTVDFAGACLEETQEGVTLHREGYDMRFKRVERAKN